MMWIRRCLTNQDCYVEFHVRFNMRYRVFFINKCSSAHLQTFTRQNDSRFNEALFSKNSHLLWGTQIVQFYPRRKRVKHSLSNYPTSLQPRSCNMNSYGWKLAISRHPVQSLFSIPARIYGLSIVKSCFSNFIKWWKMQVLKSCLDKLS